MAVTEKQFDRLEDRVSNAFERIAKLEGANGVVPKAPNAMLITLLSIIGVAVVGYWAWIGVQVVDHGKSLATINAVLAPATLRQAADDPQDPASSELVTKALNAAKEQKQRISPNLVAETAGKFVEASNTNPSAWNAALELISYRSSLNSPPAAAPSAHGSPAPRNSYVLHLDPDSGFDLPNVYLAGGSASPEDSARLESLTIRPPDRLNGTGSRFAILQGGAVVLDDEYMKNVIIRDAKVVYWGGKTRLENVYFLNCTFDIPQAPSGQNFAKAVLSSTPSNFSNV